MLIDADWLLRRLVDQIDRFPVVGAQPFHHRQVGAEAGRSSEILCTMSTLSGRPPARLVASSLLD